LDDLLVVCDDFNLPLGKIRIRPQGSDGGHNGIGSIIYHLLSDNFPRLRIGIGDNFGDTGAVDFVLSEFNPDEKKIITESIIKTKDAIFTFVDQGIQIAMNKYN
jgi:PTH1 family peptidyl-tRNA hydrolase